MPVRIQVEDFDLTTEVDAIRLSSGSAGAVVSFLGAVRDLSEGKKVFNMELEHYPGMTEKSLQAIVDVAKQRWNLIDALVIHRVGPLQAKDKIVLVATVSPHRGEAFQACEFIIDWLKTEAPFWKKEQTPEGAHWVDARSSDEMAAAKWTLTSRPDCAG